VEFSLVLPALALLAGGIMEGGFLFYTWGNMEHVGRQAARAVAIGEATPDEARTFVVQTHLRQLRVASGM
jgi:Flp pilus assembly protein TadG